MNLLLHPEVQAQLERFIQRPTHAILLEGPLGSGKYSLACWLASQLLAIEPSKLVDHPYFRHISDADGSISIDTVRLLQDFTGHTTIGKNTIRRILLIENCHSMTTEAQNAFLKLLEEPPADTVIILTAVPESGLLPTVYSRALHVRLLQPPKTSLQDYFVSQGYNQPDVARLAMMADGRIGLLAALLQKDNDHPLVAAIQQAKELLAMSAFERLARVDALAKQKDQLPTTLFALERVGHAMLLQAASKQSEPTLRRARDIMKRVLLAEKQLTYNPSAKLLLTDLFLNI